MNILELIILAKSNIQATSGLLDPITVHLSKQQFKAAIAEIKKNVNYEGPKTTTYKPFMLYGCRIVLDDSATNKGRGHYTSSPRGRDDCLRTHFRRKGYNNV